jgi:hypothetical protein
MGLLFRLSLIALPLVGLPLAAAVLMIDAEPLVTRPGGLDLDDLKRAESVAQRYDPRRMPPERITTVRATTQELNTLLKGAFGGVRQVASRVEASRFGIIGAATVELPLPPNPVGRYVNIRTVIAPSDTGLEIARFAVGGLEIPPLLVEPALRLGLDRLVGEGKGREMLDSVKSVALAGDRITIAFRPPATLVDDIKTATMRGVAVSDPATVRAYYQMIGRAIDDLPRRGVSLVEVMRPVFQLAKERSSKGDPVRENEAAMLAIAMVFGDVRFERFVGDVRTPADKKREADAFKRFRLDGRTDFVQHFTVSMGLTLTGGDIAANIIGELKEAEDSQSSSGFSFTDIGADRAGVQFARRAASSPAAARRVQEMMAAADSEQAFFPRFADLPEGMSEAVFRHRYGDVGSPGYRRVITEIDRRIAATGIYR